MSGTGNSPSRVLIAEDDPTSRRILESALSKWGYWVVTTCDGAEAWRVLQSDDPPKLAILDWMMPGMDGVDICRRIRAANEPSPPYLIILTAMGMREDVVKGLDAGANDYVTKPFNRDELRARVRVGERMLELQDALADRVRELQDALAQVKTLHGLLPICMHCHKIRDDDDAWLRLESYLEAHSEAQLSHGLCPECMDKHYPASEDDGDLAPVADETPSQAGRDAGDEKEQ